MPLALCTSTGGLAAREAKQCQGPACDVSSHSAPERCSSVRSSHCPTFIKRRTIGAHIRRKHRELGETQAVGNGTKEVLARSDLLLVGAKLGLMRAKVMRTSLRRRGSSFVIVSSISLKDDLDRGSRRSIAAAHISQSRFAQSDEMVHGAGNGRAVRQGSETAFIRILRRAA